MKNSLYNLIKNEMISWVSDCSWEDQDISSISEMSIIELTNGINKHYVGGLKGFINELILDYNIPSSVKDLCSEMKEYADIYTHVEKLR